MRSGAAAGIRFCSRRVLALRDWDIRMSGYPVCACLLGGGGGVRVCGCPDIRAANPTVVTVGN
jgi:hypothetical protein